MTNVICGYDWISIVDGKYTYYVMNSGMFESTYGTHRKSPDGLQLGAITNYKTSLIRKKLLNSNLLKNLKKEFGEKLIPINLDLTSNEGETDYGQLKGDLLSIPTLEMVRKFGDAIYLDNIQYWLATPCHIVREDYIFNPHFLFYHQDCPGYVAGSQTCNIVRPFFILKS